MTPPNPHHLGVIAKASAKASPAVTLWCLAGAWGEMTERVIQIIDPFDKTSQAQVRALIRRNHQGEVVWMVIDPNNLAHRRAVAYAFSQGKYGATRPNFDFENIYSQDMALMAFYTSKRAVNFEFYVCKMRAQGREPRLSNYSMSPRNDEISNTIHGLAADTGMAIRAMNRERNSDPNANFGRFVLRDVAELTNADITALSSGVNDLIILAQIEACLHREEFLNSIFFNWNTSYRSLGVPPKLPGRIESDASIVCGSWRTDCYSYTGRRKAKAASKLPSEMGFPERTDVQKAGAEVLIYVRPGIVAPNVGFVNRRKQFGLENNIAFRAGTYGDFLRLALRNIDHRDGDNCRSVNATLLIWLARRRLCRWYSSQEPVAWDQSVKSSVLEGEAIFQPRRPFRCYFQVFGSAKGEGFGMRDATAGDNYYPKWLGAKGD
ncbi:hypothetical protein BOTNAR_0623g00030 [Botryotinia narcissicola]|uniref:Uncharacterized protein n=1 Tax=Botryotinia narcissicola TaxID=278944 RepID=A0A4Z1HLW3_9HELO|nr:hypothetical protein BOTNAR_0623g00030 [Botryotinia narcissicola]